MFISVLVLVLLLHTLQLVSISMVLLLFGELDKCFDANILCLVSIYTYTASVVLVFGACKYQLSLPTISLLIADGHLSWSENYQEFDVGFSR